jgi:hypothetical protein
VLDREKTEVHGNSEWLAELKAADVLRLLGKATLQQVLQREDFAQRFREGAAIGAHEILYPFNQAYDSVAVRADVEIGGTDQLFNLLFGREIQKAHGQEPQDIAVFPLLEGLDGEQKMSKSLGNYIGVSEAAEQIYGKTMSIPTGCSRVLATDVRSVPCRRGRGAGTARTPKAAGAPARAPLHGEAADGRKRISRRSSGAARAGRRASASSATLRGPYRWKPACRGDARRLIDRRRACQQGRSGSTGAAGGVGKRNRIRKG